MKKLQDSILRQYKEIYPSDSLKEISKRTKIQITRVFRLFNGSEMKISEYESFYNSVSGKDKSHLQELIHECETNLSHREIRKVQDYLSYNLKRARLIDHRDLYSHTNYITA